MDSEFGQAEPNVLRHITIDEVIQNAIYLAHRGFGKDITTLINEAETVVTNELIRKFLLICGHVVSEAKELGGPCAWCRYEVELMQQQLLPQDRLTPRELDFASTPCRACQDASRCSFPMCGIGATCLRHAAEFDGKYFCRQHYEIVLEEADFQTRSARYNKFIASQRRFLNTCFFDKLDK